ncbi:hypothetical protein GCM10023148_54770 [Actinokineospora soli]
MRPDQAWARPDGLARALARMGATPETIRETARVAIHTFVDVGADRSLLSVRYHLVLRATVDGVDRYTAAYRSDRPSPTEIADTIGCRLGRRRDDDETGFLTYELLLDEPLAAGELTTIEYGMRFGGPHEERYLSQRVGCETRLVTVGARFAADLPTRVYHRRTASVADPGGEEQELRVGLSRSVRLVVADPPPGIYRLAWDWD